MQFTVAGKQHTVTINQVIVAGWTGRDRTAVNHHIDELAALGVAPPSTVPLFYRVSDGLLTQSNSIQVLGPDTSGEVEPLVIRSGGALFLGLASDHTDRALETVSVAASKQMCAKPVADTLWPLEEVTPHLDHVLLRADIKENSTWVRYQEGPLAKIVPLENLIKDADLGDDTAMLCGTLGAINGVRPASDYRMTLEDPVLGRTIALAYSVKTLPAIA